MGRKTKIKTTKMRKTSSLFIVGLIAALLASGYGGYVFYKHSSSLETMKKNEIVVEQLQAEVLKLQQNRVLEAISAKKTADQIYDRAVYWSEIIKKLRETVPKDDKLPIATITSYSGNTNKGLTLSIKTLAGRDEPYLDVADLIEAFNESEYFEGSFVPGISSGLNDRGEQILTFSVSTTYLGNDFLVPETIETSDTTELAPISR